MIFSLTDETYALYCSMNLPEGINESLYMLYVAIMARVYWLTGTIIGGLLGGFLKFDFTGIDFCMTALFVTILIDKCKVKKDRKFAITGLVCGTISLLLLEQRVLYSQLCCLLCFYWLWKENLVIRGLKIMSSLKIVAIILCSGLCTFGIRAIPFLIFRDNKSHRK